MNIYFGQPAFCCGSRKLSVEQLYDKGLIASRPELLRKAGMAENASLCGDEDLSTLLSRVLRHISKSKPQTVDALFLDTCIVQNQLSTPAFHPVNTRKDMQELIQYTAWLLLRSAGLPNIKYYGISQQGCAGLFSQIEIARSLLLSTPHANNYICLTGDAMPREYFYDREKLRILFSDCASGFLVSKTPLEYLFIDCECQTCTDKEMSQFQQMDFVSRVLKTILERNHLKPSEIENVFIQNCWPDFWKAINRRFFSPPTVCIQDEILTYGHAYSSDLVINLEARRKRGKITPNRLQLGIGYGYGTHCSALLFQSV